MRNGKGSIQRPKFITEETLSSNWENIFKNVAGTLKTERHSTDRTSPAPSAEPAADIPGLCATRSPSLKHPKHTVTLGPTGKGKGRSR